MAASAQTLILEKANNPTEDWTVVLPRRGKQRRNFPKIRHGEKEPEEKHWAPTDLESDPERDLKLISKVQNTIEKLEKSEFFRVFLEQIQTSENLDQFPKVFGTEQKMQMVLYGIGSIESYEAPRMQLSLALLMKKRFDWIGEIEVFDPIISLTESKVFESLHCSVLRVNEQGRRRAAKPILFFMPHCETDLYENLLKTNWNGEMLSQLVLFGNSFDAYRRSWSMFTNSEMMESRKHIMAIGKFTKEVEINTVSDDYFQAFQGLSWHFFSIGFNEKLEIFET